MSSSDPARIGVLVSGRGSNLQALLDAKDLGGATVAVVVSNIAGAFALERAAKARVPHEVVDHTKFAKRAEFDAALIAALKKHGVNLVCLAGFMRIIGKDFLEAFPGRVLNIHPSLLPAFPGLHAHRQAIVAGVKISGATVHFVDSGTDTGPIVLQAAVPVLAGDDEDTLGDRIVEAEHRIYPEAVRLVASGRVKIDGRTVVIDGAPRDPRAKLFNPPIP